MSRMLWQPSHERIKNTNMYKFMNIINEKYNKNFVDYSGIYNWSVENIKQFWETFWDFAQIIAANPYTDVVDDLSK
ncbi:MAG: acetoacetate--CoA ligase, partial [Desulfobacterales bacterium]|nr:acetoacetate--CoA ligase [Desulfobacterales bacterium]